MVYTPNGRIGQRVRKRVQMVQEIAVEHAHLRCTKEMNVMAQTLRRRIVILIHVRVSYLIYVVIPSLYRLDVLT